MALPNRPSIEIPLLLELERSGGRVRTPADFPAFYERIAKHFPDITPEDKKLLRSNGKTLVWHNSIDWARNHLRVVGEINGGQRGTWEITQAGRVRLRTELGNLRVHDVLAFIAGARTISQEVGSRWSPEPLRLRTRVSRRVRIEVVPAQPTPPIIGQPITPKVETTTSPKREDLQLDIHQRLLERLQSLEPTQFEHLVGEFLKAKGIMDVQVTQRSSDGGIDATGTIPFVDVKVAVQAKRYASGNNVGIEPVQRLRGSMASGFDRGIFITTSSFSAAARGWVEEVGVPITLVDGNELVSQMIDLGLGIKEKPVVETEVDEGFFEGLEA